MSTWKRSAWFNTESKKISQGIPSSICYRSFRHYINNTVGTSVDLLKLFCFSKIVLLYSVSDGEIKKKKFHFAQKGHSLISLKYWQASNAAWIITKCVYLSHPEGQNTDRTKSNVCPVPGRSIHMLLSCLNRMYCLGDHF